MLDGSTTASPEVEPLRRNRDFRLLVISQGISSVGDTIGATALPLLVLALTSSAVAMGVVYAIQALTDFGFSTVAGALADRSDRKRMMVGADLGRAVLMALIPISVLLGGPTMAVVVIVAAPLSIGRALFRAGYIASVPTIVGRPQLARANGIFETVESTMLIVGPATAGFLAFLIGPGLTLGLDAISFAISALGLSLMHSNLRAPLDRAATRIVDDIREGIVFVAHHPLLRTAILLFSLLSAVISPFVVALAVRITLDLGQSESVYGLVLTAFGVGAVAGSLVVARLGRRTNVAIALLAGIATEGAALIGIAIIDSLPAMMAMAVVGGCAETIVVVTYITLRTAHSPDALLGRIGSTARVVSLGFQPIGLLVGGLLVDTLGGSRAIAVFGAALCLLALAFVPVRALRGVTLAPPTPTAATEPGSG